MYWKSFNFFRLYSFSFLHLKFNNMLKKISLLSLVFILSLVACVQTNDSKNTQSQTEETRQIATDFHDKFWNMSDLEGGRALVADTLFLYSPTNEFKGMALTYDRMMGVRNMFANMMTGLHYEPINISSDGKHAWVLAKASYTHDQTVETKLGVFEPTGKQVDYFIMYKYTVENGKITEAYDIHDLYNRSKQMGFIPDL